MNLKGVVYCTAISEGDAEEWDFAWERYQNSNVGSEKSKLLQAMSCAQDVWLLNRYLNMSMTPSQSLIHI